MHSRRWPCSSRQARAHVHTVFITDGDHVVYDASFGMADDTRGAVRSDSTRQNIASISRTMTAGRVAAPRCNRTVATPPRAHPCGRSATPCSRHPRTPGVSRVITSPYGDRWSYPRLGYRVSALLVERVTGNSFAFDCARDLYEKGPDVAAAMSRRAGSTRCEGRHSRFRAQRFC